MNFFHHKDLGNHLLQLCPKVVKHPVYILLITEHNRDVSPQNDGTIPQLFIDPTKDYDSEDKVFGGIQLRMHGATTAFQDTS
jgi:hypothetical protein